MNTCLGCGRDTSDDYCNRCIGHSRKDDEVGRDQRDWWTLGGNPNDYDAGCDDEPEKPVDQLPFGFHEIGKRKK